MTIDPSEQNLIQKNLLRVKIIWFSNFIVTAALYFIISTLNFTIVTNQPYVHYVLGGLAMSELIVIIVMRRIRLKPSIIKTLSERGPGEVARNFFFIDVISIFLSDSILVYGVIGYVIIGDIRVLKMFAAVTALALLYFMPRESVWARQYEDSIT
jgi:hypothetical protein